MEDDPSEADVVRELTLQQGAAAVVVNIFSEKGLTRATVGTGLSFRLLNGLSHEIEMG
jgi:hypothetical protein